MSTDQIPSSLHFPSHFQFGSAVASFQVEGNIGNRRTDWDEFLQQHPDIVRPDEVGPLWWKEDSTKKDFHRLHTLGMQVQRLSFEWDRIEPEEGVVNYNAVKRYREMVDSLNELKITPIVTAYHNTLPIWVARNGGWENQKTIDSFRRYVEILVKEFPDITVWLTINEPSVLVDLGYIFGYSPPEKVNILTALHVRKNLFLAHKAAYNVIKSSLPKAHVSMAFAFRWHEPYDPQSWPETKYANLVNYLDGTSYVDGVKQELDFIGCNYYTGYFINLDLRKLKFTLDVQSGRIPKTILFGEMIQPHAYSTDYHWPIVPEFFLSLLRDLHKTFQKPIIITENGISAKHDKHRAFYILTHLVAVWQAIHEGIDVQKYFYWASVDNLEWREGYRQHFGLVYVDPVSGERTMQPSAGLYKEIIGTHTLSIEQLIKTYLPSTEQDEAERIIKKLLQGDCSMHEYK